MTAEAKELIISVIVSRKQVYHIGILYVYYIHTNHILNIGRQKYQKASKNPVVTYPKSYVNHLCNGTYNAMLPLVSQEACQFFWL